MKSDPVTMKRGLLFLMIFALSILGSAYVHELGHSLAGLVQGVPVVATPFKEYILQEHIEWRQQILISMGGVVASVLVVVGALIWYNWKRPVHGDSILAGVMVIPFAYTLRFLLVGRGHDGLEWQAAQSALGAKPTGHAVDIMFLALSFAAIVIFMVRRRPSLSFSSLIKAGSLMAIGIALLIVFQVSNNILFDGVFTETQIVNLPPGLESE
jgi:amino acid permease